MLAAKQAKDDVDAKKKMLISFKPACTPVSEHQEEVNNNGALCMFKCKHLCK